jgi:hypothetical protein
MSAGTGATDVGLGWALSEDMPKKESAGGSRFCNLHLFFFVKRKGLFSESRFKIICRFEYFRKAKLDSASFQPAGICQPWPSTEMSYPALKTALHLAPIKGWKCEQLPFKFLGIYSATHRIKMASDCAHKFQVG